MVGGGGGDDDGGAVVVLVVLPPSPLQPRSVEDRANNLDRNPFDHLENQNDRRSCHRVRMTFFPP